jgi:CHAT domain-containing protein
LLSAEKSEVSRLQNTLAASGPRVLGIRLLLGNFYARWIKYPTQGKAEALRQAQLAFLHGSTGASSKVDRGSQIEHDSNSKIGAAVYSHPFYWAPFVLTGNYQ